MLARLEPLLAFEAGEKASILRLKRGRKAAIVVKLPPECDKAMLRDGIEPKPPKDTPDKFGEKAWWLVQLLAAVPPSTWTRKWQVSPSEIVHLAQGHAEWGKLLLRGLALAAGRHRDGEFAAAFAAEPALLGRMWPDEAEAVLEALDTPGREQFLTHLLTQQSLLNERNPSLAQLLLACRHNWSIPFSQAVMRNLQPGLGKVNWTHREMLMDLAGRVEPASAAALTDGWHMPESNKVLEEFLDLLYFRRDALAAIGEPDFGTDKKENPT